MMIFDSLDAVAPDFGPSAVTIGKFDGVHSGHRRIIAGVREIAASIGTIPWELLCRLGARIQRDYASRNPPP